MHVVEPLAATIGIQCGLYKRGGHISGFPPYCNTVRTKVSGCYREGGCSSGVVIKKGLIHYIYTLMWHILFLVKINANAIADYKSTSFYIIIHLDKV